MAFHVYVYNWVGEGLWQWGLVILCWQWRVPLHHVLYPDTFFIHEWFIHIPSVPALTLWGGCQSLRLMWSELGRGWKKERVGCSRPGGRQWERGVVEVETFESKWRKRKEDQYHGWTPGTFQKNSVHISVHLSNCQEREDKEKNQEGAKSKNGRGVVVNETWDCVQYLRKYQSGRKVELMTILTLWWPHHCCCC